MPNELPEIDFTQSIDDIRKQFESALADIQAALKSFLLTDAKRQDLLEAERTINDILSDLEQTIDKWADETAESVVGEAFVAALIILGIEQHKEKRQQAALLAYVSEALRTDLKAVTANLNRQTRTVMRRSYTDATKRTTTQSRTEISRTASKMLDDADIAIIDKAGRRWKTTHYIDMLTRTTMAEAEREAVAITGITSGNGHAYISYNATTTDACKDHHYKIVKLSPDISSQYPYYRDLPHIFHPCCRHRLIPISSFDNLPAQVRSKNRV